MCVHTYTHTHTCFLALWQTGVNLVCKIGKIKRLKFHLQTESKIVAARRKNWLGHFPKEAGIVFSGYFF